MKRGDLDHQVVSLIFFTLRSQGGRAANQRVLWHRFENPLPLVARLCQKLNDP